LQRRPPDNAKAQRFGRQAIAPQRHQPDDRRITLGYRDHGEHRPHNLYWQIGKRIIQEILKGQRAEYGEAIVSTLSRQLVEMYGRSFMEKNLREWFSLGSWQTNRFVVSLIRQFS
jgi:DUF1016 N-terminal domain